MKLSIENIERHRNGVGGAPFNVLLFQAPDEGRMVGIVFDQEYHVAVFNLDKLAQGDIAFGSNSWRGNHYEPHLRHAVTLAGGTHDELDLNAMLGAHRQIAVVWSTEDVLEVRPDLTKDQAWQVLQATRRGHDATLGINWDVLRCHADMLFDPPSEHDESGGQP